MKSINALTFDLEDWHQLASQKLLGLTVPASERVVVNTTWILELLARHKCRATFFVLGKVAVDYPNLIRRIAAEGHEVATHGYNHQLVAKLGPKAFEDDLHRSIEILAEIVQQPILGHRAAEFSMNGAEAWAMEILASAGIRYDSSVFPIRHPRYGMPAAPRHPYPIHTSSGMIVEFPLATTTFLGQNLPVAGGGYLRVLPLTFCRRGIEKLNREGGGAVTYFHPYEFDEKRLEIDVPSRSAFHWFYLQHRAIKRNLGRGKPMQAKLVRLLSDFQFSPLFEILAEMDYGSESPNTGVFSAPCQPLRPAL